MPASQPTRPAIVDHRPGWAGRVTNRADAAPTIVSALRSLCLDLPGAYEEKAWAGTRCCVHGKTFAHVLRVEAGWPPAYARAVRSSGPVTLLTFRSSDPGLYDDGRARHPFFRPGWFPNLVGMVLGSRVDWAEVMAVTYAAGQPKARSQRGHWPLREGQVER